MPRIDPRAFLAVALLAAAAACARNEQPASATAEAADLPRMQETAPALPIEDAAAGGARAVAAVQPPGVDAARLASTANSASDPERRFVRTAQASFQVTDVYASALAIEDAAAADGGFVVKNHISTRTLRELERPAGDFRRVRLSEVETRGSLVVRVPSGRTQAFLRAIAKQMQFLDARSFEANDVQFDLLRRELAHRRAQALQQDMRALGAQPGRTGERLDAAHARAEMLAARDEALVTQRELEDRIAFSTLTLELRQPLQVREQAVPDTEAILRERGPGFFAQLGEALRSGWRGLLAAAVAGARLWPLWLLLAGVALGLRAWRRRRAGTTAS